MKYIVQRRYGGMWRDEHGCFDSPMLAVLQKTDLAFANPNGEYRVIRQVTDPCSLRPGRAPSIAPDEHEALPEIAEPEAVTTAASSGF